MENDKNSRKRGSINPAVAVKGLIIGGTMLVPGVSGGSMAIILGIYDELVSSVSSFMKSKRKHFLFLLVFGVSGLVGMFLFSKPLLRLIEAYPMPMLYFFMGAVAGGVPLIFKQSQLKRFSVRGLFYVLLGLAIVLGLAVIPVSGGQSAMDADLKGILYLALAGFIAAVALVLPGISVSYLLLVMGLYDELMRAISQFYMPFLIPLGVGLILVIILTTKILEKAMNSYPQPTYLIILGFVLGSMGEVFPGIPTGIEIPVCACTLLAGFGCIMLLSYREAKNQ